MKVLKTIVVVAILMFVSRLAHADDADDSAVSLINELLRRERAAVATYDQALEKIQSPAGREQLAKYKGNHQKAASTLQAEVKSLGGTPDTSAGAWGEMAEAAEGGAKLLGSTAALKVLKEQEEHGIEEYRELLENKNVPSRVKDMVQKTLIPNQEAHIRGLDSLMAASVS